MTEEDRRNLKTLRDIHVKREYETGKNRDWYAGEYYKMQYDNSILAQYIASYPFTVAASVYFCYVMMNSADFGPAKSYRLGFILPVLVYFWVGRVILEWAVGKVSGWYRWMYILMGVGLYYFVEANKYKPLFWNSPFWDKMEFRGPWTGFLGAALLIPVTIIVCHVCFLIYRWFTNTDWDPRDENWLK